MPPISKPLDSMIRKESQEWAEFVHRLESIKQKSNRQVLCLACWELLNYEQKTKHFKAHPDHASRTVTSSKFASSWQFYSLALAYDKVIERDNEQFIIVPFDYLRTESNVKPPTAADRILNSTHPSYEPNLVNDSKSSNTTPTVTGCPNIESMFSEESQRPRKRSDKEREKFRLRAIQNSLDQIGSSVVELKGIYASSMLMYADYKLLLPTLTGIAPALPSYEAAQRRCEVRQIDAISAYLALRNSTPSNNRRKENLTSCWEPSAKRARISF